MRWYSAEQRPEIPPGVGARQVIVCRRFDNGNRLVSSLTVYPAMFNGAAWAEVTHWMPMPEPPDQ